MWTGRRGAVFVALTEEGPGVMSHPVGAFLVVPLMDGTPFYPRRRLSVTGHRAAFHQTLLFPSKIGKWVWNFFFFSRSENDWMLN